MRISTVWFALIMLLVVPAYASLQSLCCSPQSQGSASCCAAAMKGDTSSGAPMEAMDALPSGQAMSYRDCSMDATTELPDVGAYEAQSRLDLLPLQNELSALALRGDSGLLVQQLVIAAVSVEGSPPRGSIPFDPLLVSLRI
jgi:hypothetical protein